MNENNKCPLCGHISRRFEGISFSGSFSEHPLIFKVGDWFGNKFISEDFLQVAIITEEENQIIIYLTERRGKDTHRFSHHEFSKKFMLNGYSMRVW